MKQEPPRDLHRRTALNFVCLLEKKRLVFFHDVVPWLPLGFRFIFDCLGGTSANTGHTVGTGSLPDWSFLLHCNVSERTFAITLAAPDAGIGKGKARILNKKGIKERIDQSALQSSKQGGPRLWKGLPLGNVFCNGGNVRACGF